MPPRTSGLATVLALWAAMWAVNFLWLERDTRLPAWDMALHQSYALNYWPGAPSDGTPLPPAERSGTYPPWVHLMIALSYFVFHPGPHIAVLANIPATLLLLWCVYLLGEDLAGASAGRWACVLTALIPFMIWMSRETILDYWLAAWTAAGLVALRRTDRFQSHGQSLWFGVICALGLLTKWFFAALLVFPVLAVCIRSRIWRSETRLIHLADAAMIAGLGAGVWYLPNLPRLGRYFLENAAIGAREGEPPVFSFQSLIYYLRLLEGYQLFGLLFLVLGISVIVAWKRRLVRDGWFLAAAVIGGWVAMTLLRTKDPRFTLPLLGPLMVIAGAWVAAWTQTAGMRILQAGLIVVLVFQAYAANFGVRGLPEAIVLARGYQGSLRWDWNLYLQNYFHILGPPRREDWKQEEILRRLATDARDRKVEPSLALIPDLPRFNAENFRLMARLRGIPARIAHLQAGPDGMVPFAGYDYVIMAEGDQGMSWSTVYSRALNQYVVDHPDVFRLVELYLLPGGSSARLYFIARGVREADAPPDRRAMP